MPDMPNEHHLTIFKPDGDSWLQIPAEWVQSVEFEGSVTTVRFALEGGEYEQIETTLPCVYRRRQDT